MILDIFTNLRIFTKKFRFTKTTLSKMITGKVNKEKQLFAYTILSFNKKFVNDVISNKNMILLKGIEYFTREKAEKTFGFRKKHFNTWKTKERKNLIKCLENTPVCFTKNFEAWLLMMESTQSLFAIAEEYNISSDICSNCSLHEQCKRDEKS